MSSIINNYGELFDAISKRITDHSSVKFTFNQCSAYGLISEYGSDIKAHKDSICNFWDINIPGNSVSKVFFIEDSEDIKNISGFYRIEGSLWCILNMNTSILYSETAKRADVAKFFDDYRNIISKLLSVEDYTDFFQKQILIFFASFDLIYRVFAASKEIFVAMAENDGLHIFIDKDNLVYENCVNLIANRSKSISEGRIISAVLDGVKNVSNNSIQARLMPNVQETSD